MAEPKLPLDKYLKNIGQEITEQGQFDELVGRVSDEPLDFIDHLDAISTLLLTSARNPNLVPTERIESAMFKLYKQTLTPKALAKIFPGVNPDQLKNNPDYIAYTDLEKQLRKIRDERIKQ